MSVDTCLRVGLRVGRRVGAAVMGAGGGVELPEEHENCTPLPPFC